MRPARGQGRTMLDGATSMEELADALELNRITLRPDKDSTLPLDVANPDDCFRRLIPPPASKSVVLDKINHPKEKSHRDKFLMAIDDVFTIEGGRCVVTGTIESGTIHIGDNVQVKGFGNCVKTTVSGVEMFRKLLDQAEHGDNVGLLLRANCLPEVERGMIVSSMPVKTVTEFTAAVYMYNQNKNVPNVNLMYGSDVDISSRTADLKAQVIGLSSDSIHNGGYAAVRFKLPEDIYLEKDDIVMLQKGADVVGVGLVYDF